MPSDRLREVERIYHDALDRPLDERQRFVDEACHGDDALRLDVQSLLDQASGGAFLARPAIDVAADLAESAGIVLLTGSRLGQYEIQDLLGKGGMGEVYRARDVRLGRDVAIKVLPRAFTADPVRLARFAREARVLATLNHPHIGSIHGVEEADGIHAIVLELVEGQTLADRIARGPVPIDEALAIVRQIADALEATHEKGIVHRDLKPANIKITPAGVVKVLDFGLARMQAGGDSGEDAPSPLITVDGAGGPVLGTAAYMSPEQARGLAVDRRADVWAFGCVLYEMLSGKRAFPGATVSDTLVAILHYAPDWSALPSATPEALVTLLRRCLEKDVKRRRRDIGDVRQELDQVMTTPPARAPLPGAAASTSVAGRILPWAVAAVSVAACALLIAWWPWQNPLADATFRRLTNFPGTETDAAVSPDGKLVAFLSDHTGPLHLWVTQIGTAHFTDLTPGVNQPRGGASNRVFGFDADGANIGLSGGPGQSDADWLDPDRRRFQTRPVSGGPATVRLGEKVANVSWSPDKSRRIVYNLWTDGDPLEVADENGGNEVRIYTPPAESGLHNHGAVWSTDGQWIYFVHGYAGTEEMEMYRIRPAAGSRPEPMTQRGTAVSSLTPIDPDTILYIARDDDGSGPAIWALDVRTKVSRRATRGIEQFTSLSASADGKRLVASVANSRSSLWQVPILHGNELAQSADVSPHGPDSVRAWAPKLVMDTLFYHSASGSDDALWRVQTSRPDSRPGTVWPFSQGALLEPSAVSPNGRQAAIVRGKNGRRILTIVEVDGGTPRDLDLPFDVRGRASWSPDGQYLVAVLGPDQPKSRGVFLIPVNGGQPSRLFTGDAWAPLFWKDKDGEMILYAGPNTSGHRDLRARRLDGRAVEMPDVRMRDSGVPVLCSDRRTLVFLGGSEFFALDLLTRAVRQLTKIASANAGVIRTFDVTPNCQSIVFDRLIENSDIVVIDLARR